MSWQILFGQYSQGFWIYLYFRIRHSFAHLRPVILSADWSIRRLQSWTCSSLPTVAEFVKLTQSIVIEIQRQFADLYKVQLCNRQFFVGVPAIYVVKVYECHPLGTVFALAFFFEFSERTNWHPVSNTQRILEELWQYTDSNVLKWESLYIGCFPI